MRIVSRLAVVMFACSLLLFPLPVHAVTERPPDLVMARLRNFTANTVNGQRQLRFTTIITNVGAGPLQISGSRVSTSDTTMNTVVQRLFDDAGGHRDVTTTATMYFGGDGHNHWHLLDLESYELERLNGVVVGTGEKHGFCFFDNYRYRLSLPNAPQNPVYPGCGTINDLQVTTGLSVGWGDKYGARLPDQFIDITGLVAGTYRLTATADESNWFVESNDQNNRTCVNLQITGGGVSVVSQGCG